MALRHTLLALQDELDRIEAAKPTVESGYGEEDGRIGEAKVIMSDRGSGNPHCCPKTGKVESTSNFGTALGTAGVIKGKWMYAIRFNSNKCCMQLVVLHSKLQNHAQQIELQRLSCTEPCSVGTHHPAHAGTR
jgi:hypothetical protein